MIYLDNNATTMMAPEVLEAMLPYLRDQYANPSSIHQFGQQMRHAVETAREQIAAILGVSGREIVFTSGGTEANDLAIRGVLAARAGKRHLVTTSVEHDSVLGLVRQLEKEQYRATYVNVDSHGRMDLEELAAALTDDTALASVIHANNETGMIFPLEEIGKIAQARGVPLHIDATQTVGKLPLDLAAIPAQLVTMAAHKFHGPKGVGFLVVRRGTRIRGRMIGGHQERDLRPGTENVAGIVGMAEALRLAVAHVDEENTRVCRLRDRLEAGLCQRVSTAHVIGDVEHRLPNTTSIGFESLEAEAILMLLSNAGVCASSGSACSSGSLEPSHVLEAMGIPQHIAHGTVRLSLSRFTTEQEIDAALKIIPEVIGRLSALQPWPEADQAKR